MLQWDTCKDGITRVYTGPILDQRLLEGFVAIRKTSPMEIFLDNQPGSDVANNKAKTTGVPVASSEPTKDTDARLTAVQP